MGSYRAKYRSCYRFCWVIHQLFALHQESYHGHHLLLPNCSMLSCFCGIISAADDFAALDFDDPYMVDPAVGHTSGM